MEYGLCCLFYKEPIKFKSYTYANIKKIEKENGIKSARKKVTEIWKHNIKTLQQAINYCKNNDIKSYRVSSDLFPQFDKVIKDGIIEKSFLKTITKELSKINSYDIILSMHPGQHVNIGSPNKDVVKNSIQDLKYHFFVAKPLNCKEINIHIGGSYGDKKASLKRFISNIKKYLTKKELNLITIENDELNYSIKDTYETAKKLGIRCIYDIHHQRCFELKYPKDGNEKEYFKWAKETWKNYDYQRIHISTPRDGYTTQSKSRPHHDFINKNEFPDWILKIKNLHVDIEAKAKEIAIKKLQKDNLKKTEFK
ncbi:MAG: UV DNA damage repair endonuclease UvsE [Alphaproteobacteria bacterium]|jgi:UV DNA damage endonuclease|nr:UV DNA damage repair endonuclease UvsE [Alphaproteobacteria bacterium]